MGHRSQVEEDQEQGASDTSPGRAACQGGTAVSGQYHDGEEKEQHHARLPCDHAADTDRGECNRIACRRLWSSGGAGFASGHALHTQQADEPNGREHDE